MARARSAKEDKKFWLNEDDWSPEFAAAAITHFDAFQDRLESSKRHARIQRSWRLYFSRGKGGNCDTTEIGAAGRKGEVLLIQSNRFARLVRDHITLVQQTPMQPEPMAANADAKSQDKVGLAKGIIEHYKRECDLETVKQDWAFVAELCGDAFLHIPWDPDLGKELAVGPMQSSRADEASEMPESAGAEELEPEGEESPQRVIYEGDYDFEVCSPYTVAYERSTKNIKKPGWTIVKSPVNKWNFLAQVREEERDPDMLAKLERAILKAERWTDAAKKLDYDADEDDHDDQIAVYYVYGDRCRARPQGRRAIVIDKKTVYFDGPLGEPRIPVFRLSQGEVLFRNEAHTPNHDGLPLSEALAAQLSTIVSNNANHGLQRVISARKANVDSTELDTGAASINYDHQDKAGNPIPPPLPWVGLAPNPELYTAYNLLSSELDLNMGGSAVTRGDPNATQGDSGAKVAALFAAAQNIGSSFVGKCVRGWEEVFTFLIASLRHHATSKRVVTIVGEHNSFAAKEYVGEDLEGLMRVTVSQADAMRDTIAGRLAMNEAIQGQTPEQQKQTIAILSTGRMEPVTDESEPARLLLVRENEALRDGREPHVAAPNDPHAEHWKGHMDQLASPDVRNDPMARKRVLDAAAEHAAYLTVGSPVFDEVALLMTGQAPLPLGGMQPGLPAEQPGPYAGPAGPNDAPGAGAQPPQPQEPGTPPGMPQKPSMPSMPTNPTNGQKMNAGPNGGPPKPPGKGVAA